MLQNQVPKKRKGVQFFVMGTNGRDYIESNVTILANPPKEKLNSPVFLDTLFIGVTLSHEIFSIANQEVDLRSRNIDYEMISQLCIRQRN